jgi:hypothetical protein
VGVRQTAGGGGHNNTWMQLCAMQVRVEAVCSRWMDGGSSKGTAGAVAPSAAAQVPVYALVQVGAWKERGRAVGWRCTLSHLAVRDGRGSVGRGGAGPGVRGGSRGGQGGVGGGGENA